MSKQCRFMNLAVALQDVWLDRVHQGQLCTDVCRKWATCITLLVSSHFCTWKNMSLRRKKNLDCLHSFLHVMNVTEYIPIMQASLATKSVIMIDLGQIYEWFNVSEKLQKELQFHQSLENLWASWKKFTKQTRPCKEQLSLSHVQ